MGSPKPSPSTPERLVTGSDEEDEAEVEEHPAMSARWSIRRRMSGTVSEYPAWFNPDAVKDASRSTAAAAAGAPADDAERKKDRKR